MKKILCLLMCLLVLIGCAASNEETKDAANEEEINEVKYDVPAFTITVCGKEITEKDMEPYALKEYEVNTVNSKGTEKTYKYVGYSIKDVLKFCEIYIDDGEVVATATDGYETEYTDNIILDTTIIAVLRDGEAFEEGPWLAPCSSSTNGDYLKNLKEIKIAVN